MHNADENIAELERLLSPARAQYQALRHHKPLRMPTTVRSRRRRWPSLAIAASIVLAAAMVGISMLEDTGRQKSRTLLAFERPAALPLSLRPSAYQKVKRPAVKSTGLKLPRRPAKLKG